MSISDKLERMAQDERDCRRSAIARLMQGDIQGAKAAAIASLHARQEIINKTIDLMNGFEDEGSNGHDRNHEVCPAPMLEPATNQE